MHFEKQSSSIATSRLFHFSANFREDKKSITLKLKITEKKWKMNQSQIFTFIACR